MEGNFANIFIEPYTLEGQPLDFILNDHFFSDVSFIQFDPLNNGYLTGFILSILCAMVKQQATSANNAQYRIDDVLFGVLESNDAIKSIAVVENMTSGEKIMLIQNFYFLNNTSNLKNRGLSMSERKNVETMLQNKLEEKMVEFLIYRINTDPFENFVCNQSNKVISLYVERITDVQRGVETTENQVEKFIKLSDFMSSSRQLTDMLDEKNSAIISVIIEQTASLLYKVTDNCSSRSSAPGFIHGNLLTSSSKHKHSVKVSIYGEQNPAIRLSLEPPISLKRFHNLSRPFSFDLSPPNTIIGKPIGNFLARLIEVAAAPIVEVVSEKFILEMASNLITQLLFSDKMRRKKYMSTFVFGMLYTQQAEITEVRMSKRRTSASSQIILQLSRKQRIIVFNFDKTAQLSIEGLKLKNFAFGRPTTHVFVISIFERETGCNRDLSIKDLSYDVNVTVLKPSFKHYPPNSNSHVYLEKNNFLTSLLNLHKRDTLENAEIVYENLLDMLLKTIDLLGRGLETYRYFLEGALHHLNYMGSNHQPAIKVDMFYSEAAYCVRLKTDAKITLINFVNTGFPKQFVTYYREHQILEDFNYGLFTFVYDYKKATDIFGLYLLLRMDIDNDFLRADPFAIFRMLRCFHYENKMYADCPLDTIIDPSSHDIPAEDNKIFPESYRIYLKILNRIRKFTSDDISESAENQQPRGGSQTDDSDLIKDVRPIINHLAIPSYSFLDYFSSSLMVHSTFDFIDFIKKEKLSKKLFNSALKGYKILNERVLPVIGIVLGVDGLYNAIEAYTNGDKSSYAIFNIFSAATSLALSITLIAVEFFQLFASVVPVVGWVVSAVLYVVTAVWNAENIMEQVNTIIQLSAWENVEQKGRLIFLLGLSHDLEKDLGDIPYNEHILKNVLAVMNKDHNIKHYISSASCFDEGRYRPCRDAYVDLRDKYILDKDLIARSGPEWSAMGRTVYKQLCDLTRIVSTWRAVEQHELAWLPSYETHPIRSFNFPINTFFDDTNVSSIPVGYQASYACNNAIGVSRKKFHSGPGDISLYNFVGDATIYAKVDTINFILLSRGRYCSIVGGDKINIFQFVTIYEVCFLEGSDVSANIVDFSALIDSPVIYTISTHYVKLEYKKWTTDKTNKQQHSSYIYLKNINTFIVSEKKERDFINIKCLIGNIDVKRKTECTSLYPITVDNPIDSCTMQVQIRSEGCIQLENNALNGKFLYTFHDMTGNVRIILENTSNITHRIELPFVKHAKNLILQRDKVNAYIKFTYGEWTFSVVIKSLAESLQLSFADGIHVRYKANRFFAEIISEKTIGRMWYDNRNLFHAFNQSNIECRAYSEWNDESVLLRHKYIRMERTGRHFGASSEFSDEQIVFTTGYNVHLIIPDKCQLRQILFKPVDWLFTDRNITVTGSIDALIIDLTLVVDSLSVISKRSRLNVDLTMVGHILNVEVYAHVQHMDKNNSFRAGGIRLRDMMFKDRYKAVRIVTKSEFILVLNLSGKLEIKSVQKIVDPLNPVVILDMHTVEYGQTIFFKDRALINYDLVLVDGSTLIITNLASNMMKGLLLDAATVPFLTVVVEQYTDEKMRSLKLKFEQGLQFDLDKLDKDKIISLADLLIKIETMNKHMKQKPFIFRRDPIYDANEIRVKLWR